MPEYRIDRPFLGDAAIRINRALDISGLISPQFEPGEKILPVVVVDDLQRAGLGAQRGRRFMAFRQGIAGTGPWFTAPAVSVGQLVVERVLLAVDVAGTVIQIRYLPASLGTSGVAPPGAFIERAAELEVPPILIGNSGAIGTVVGQVAEGTPRTVVLELNAFFPAGVGLQFLPVAATTALGMTVFGRAF